MIVWFAVANWAVEFSGIPQLGATTNYYLPGWSAFALLLPAAIEFVRERAHSVVSVPRFITAMLAAGALLLWSAQLGYASCDFGARFFGGPRNVSYEPLGPYRIISDRSVVALYGHDPELLDSFAVHSLELKGVWSSAPVVADIEQEKYDLILMLRVNYKRVAPNYRGISDFSPAILSAINEKYVVLCSTMSHMILKPRDRDVALSPEYFGQMLDVRCGTGLANKSPKLTVDKDSQ